MDILKDIASQVTFKIENDEVEVKAPSELYPIAETFEDLGTWPEIWQEALDTLNSKKPFPHWVVGDGCAVHIEEDGTWFGVQPEFKGPRVKVANEDTKELISRFMATMDEASKQ